MNVHAQSRKKERKKDSEWGFIQHRLSDMIVQAVENQISGCDLRPGVHHFIVMMVLDVAPERDLKLGFQSGQRADGLD